MYRYCPPNSRRRDPNEIFITGDTQQSVDMAKQRLHDAAMRVRVFVKDVQITPAKIDTILLNRLDKIRKVMETNATYIMFPPLASQRNTVRVQGLDVLHVERAIRELMALVCCSNAVLGPPPAMEHGLLTPVLGWSVLQRLLDHPASGPAPTASESR